MRPSAEHGVTRPYRLLACVGLVLVACVIVLALWTPPFSWLLTPHSIVRHALRWLHDHWLNAPAVTAGATILLAVVGLVPLYIGWQNRRSSNAVREKVEDHVQSAATLTGDDAADAGTLVIGDVPREPVAYQPRHELFANLCDAARSQRVAVVCALTGARGVGKTHLVSAYARQCIAEGWPLGSARVAEMSRVRVILLQSSAVCHWP